jgi:hypothetical protein
LHGGQSGVLRTGKKIGYVLDYFWDKGAKINKIP